MSDSKPRIEIDVGLDLLLLTRANVIGNVAADLARRVELSDSTVRRIQRGFARRLLERVEIVLFADKDETEIVGYLRYSCDWDNHVIILTTGSGEPTFRIDPDRPLTGQISKSLELVESYISRKYTLANVASKQVWYTAAEGMRDEMRADLGTSNSPDPEGRAKLKEARAQFSGEFELTPGALGEVTVEGGFR